MQSAFLSDFKKSFTGVRTRLVLVFSGIGTAWVTLSPISRAFCISLWVGLTLFVATDFARGTFEGQHSVAQQTKLIGAALSHLSPEEAAPIFIRLTNALPQGYGALADVNTSNRLVLQSARATMWDDSGFIASETVAGPLGNISVSMPRSAIFAGVYQRAAAGIALALLGSMALLRSTPRTKRDPDAPVDFAFSTAPTGAAHWAENGVAERFNPAFTRTFGLPPSAVHFGQTYKQLRALLEKRGQLEIISEDSLGRKSIWKGSDGRVIAIEDCPIPGGGLVSHTMDLTEAHGMNRQLNQLQQAQIDLTEKLRQEKQRVESVNQAKTSFLAHLSHEVRTPLNHIIGFSDLLGHQSFGPLGDARYTGYVSHIKQSGEKLLASFDEVLELAELESGARVLKTQPLLIIDLLEDVMRRFRDQARRANVSLELACHCDKMLLGDQVSLKKMIGNIIDNALRFTPSGGRVILASWGASDGVVVEISDNGSGIETSRLASLGEAFSIGENVLKRKTSGAGLGIAIARAIAEQNGGKLIIDSRPQAGTTVAISLPIGINQPEQTQVA